MKRLPLIVLLLTALTSTVQAQLDEPDELIVRNYDAELQSLSRNYAANPTGVEQLYKLALFYIDGDNPMRNIPLAMTYIRLTEERHIYLLEKNKINELTRLTKRDIDLSSIRRIKQLIHSAALSELKKQHIFSATELDYYQEVFDGDIEMLKLIRAQRIKQSFRDAMEKGTAEAFYAFMESHPAIAESEQAEQRLLLLVEQQLPLLREKGQVDSLASLYSQSSAVQRAAERRKSQLAFRQAERIGTLAAYESFLKQYPAADEQLIARQRIELIRDADFSISWTTSRLATYVEENPDNPLADDALAELRRRINEEHDVEAAQTYINLFPYDEFHGEVFSTFYSWHAIEGNGAPLRRFAAQHPDFPMQRALESDLDRSYEIDRADLTGIFRESQVEDYGSYIRRFTGKRIALVPLQRMLQGLLLAHNYHEAQKRAWDYEICFDGIGADEYRELLDIISTPATHAHQRTSLFHGNFDINNPAINSNDGCLYFTRTQRPLASRIYCVKRGKKGWEVPSEVKIEGVNAVGLLFFGFMPGGDRMLIGTDGDVWIADREGDHWRVSEIPPYPVNTDYLETDARMLPDGSGMLLASDRPGGHNLQRSGDYFHGDTAIATDIYFIPLHGGTWGAAIRLGEAINTPYCERSPLLSRNMRTLYFTTDSRGLGYGDIYVATRTSTDDWSHWSKPRNLGREANSGFIEGGLNFVDGERNLLFVSNAENGHFACYKIATQHDTIAQGTACHVKLPHDGDRLTRLRVVDLSTQKLVEQHTSFDSTAELTLLLNRESQYAVLGDVGERFMPAVMVSEKNMQAVMMQSYSFAELVAMDKPLPLPAVEFSRDGKLTTSAKMQMEQLAQFASRNPNSEIELVITQQGRDDEQCYKATLAQGAQLRDYLIDTGVPHVLISAYGNALDGKSGVSLRMRERRSPTSPAKH